MATDKQIDANRRNARKSTGPSTPEGKAASRFNALKHGIDARSQTIPGEDPDELEALARQYYDEHRPQGPTQRHLVDRLVLCDWLRRRYHRIQAEVLSQVSFEVQEHSEYDESQIAIGYAFLETCRSHSDALVKIFRQINANDRTWDRALAALERLRTESRAAAPPEPAAPAHDLHPVTAARSDASTPPQPESPAAPPHPAAAPNPLPSPQLASFRRLAETAPVVAHTRGVPAARAINRAVPVHYGPRVLQ